MKKISLIVVTLFLAAGFVTTSAEEISLNTVIPSVATDTCSVAAYTIDPALQTEVVLDPYVQSSINECLGTTGAVTMQQLQNLQYIALNFSGATTASLSGLENATNLEYVFIGLSTPLRTNFI